MINKMQDSSFLIQAKIIILFCFACIASFLTYVGIDTEIFAIYTGLLVIDFLTGVVKARRLGLRVTSNRAKYGILSKMSLILIPLVLGLTTKAIGVEANTLFIWSLNILIASEAYSILGNIYTIRNKKELPEWDVISLIGKKIRNTFEDAEKKSGDD